MPVSRTEILKLYRSLMRYSKSLRFTDSEYFCRRVTSEFRLNKKLTDPEEIDFAFKKGEALLHKGAVV